MVLDCLNWFSGSTEQRVMFPVSGNRLRKDTGHFFHSRVRSTTRGVIELVMSQFTFDHLFLRDTKKNKGHVNR